MNILAFDTSSKYISVGLIKDRIFDGLYSETQLTHSQTLMPSIDKLLKKNEVNARDIDYIGVTQGPGSFTGLRIGCATGKGLAISLNKPLVGLSSIEAMAHNFLDLDCYSAPIMDARRQQVYTGLYKINNGECEVIIPDKTVNIDEWIMELKALDLNKLYLSGDGSPLYYQKFLDILGDLVVKPLLESLGALPRSLGSMTLRKIMLGKDIYSPSEFLPNYLRDTNTKKPDGKGVPCGCSN
jgi:tRNA threonylcarbamoyladenosine biosynthesis protein TsaB